jgi:hypothetical protein
MALFRGKLRSATHIFYSLDPSEGFSPCLILFVMYLSHPLFYRADRVNSQINFVVQGGHLGCYDVKDRKKETESIRNHKSEQEVGDKVGGSNHDAPYMMYHTLGILERARS